MRWRAKAGDTRSTTSRSRRATISWWSAAASAGLPRPGTIAARGPRRASSCSTTTTISAARPSATNSRSMAAASSAMAAASRCNRRNRCSARSPRVCCAISASISRDSRPRSSASSIPLSACRAACSSTREAFGRDVLVTGEPARGNADESPPPQCQAAAGVRRGIPGVGGEQGADARALAGARRSAGRQIRRRERRRSSSAPAIAIT